MLALTVFCPFIVCKSAQQLFLNNRVLRLVFMGIAGLVFHKPTFFHNLHIHRLSILQYTH